jgi:hypothetical protein
MQAGADIIVRQDHFPVLLVPEQAAGVYELSSP